MNSWIYLFLAIISEVIGTTALNASAGFTRPIPSLVVVLGYGAAFYLLSLTLNAIPMGIAYAIWSGIGISLITVIGHFFFGQKLDGAALAGIALIMAGVMVINVFSKAGHSG